VSSWCIVELFKDTQQHANKNCPALPALHRTPLEKPIEPEVDNGQPLGKHGTEIFVELHTCI